MRWLDLPFQPRKIRRRNLRPATVPAALGCHPAHARKPEPAAVPPRVRRAVPNDSRDALLDRGPGVRAPRGGPPRPRTDRAGHRRPTSDLVRPGGSLRMPDAGATISAVNRLLELARAHRMRVVYSLDTHRDGDPDWQTWPSTPVRAAWAGSSWRRWRRPRETVIRKLRCDAFYGTRRATFSSGPARPARDRPGGRLQPAAALRVHARRTRPHHVAAQRQRVPPRQACPAPGHRGGRSGGPQGGCGAYSSPGLA
jgi:hypothetical protein